MQKATRRVGLFILATFCCAILAGVASAQPQTAMFWSQAEGGTIHRADLLNGGSIVLSSGTPYPFGVSVDVTGGHVYWTHQIPNVYPEEGRIFRSNLDGSGQVLFTHRVGVPIKVAVAHSLGKVYWTQRHGSGTGPGRIVRSNLDGSGIQELLPFGGPHDLILDEPNGRMYWSDDNGRRIRRANLNGSVVTDLVVAPNSILGLAIDFTAEQMYWVALQSGTSGRDIMTARLDGSQVQMLIPNVHAEANGLDIDPVARKLYWSEAFGIKRSNPDGTGIELVLPRNYEPFGQDLEIVVIPEPIWSGTLMLLAATACRRRVRPPTLANPPHHH